MRRTYLQLLLVQLHLLQLVPDGLHVPGSVVSLQVVELRVAEAPFQLLKRVVKLKDEETESHKAVFRPHTLSFMWTEVQLSVV